MLRLVEDGDACGDSRTPKSALRSFPFVYFPTKSKRTQRCGGSEINTQATSWDFGLRCRVTDYLAGEGERKEKAMMHVQ